MNDVVIRAEGLSKKYQIGHEVRQQETSLRDALARRMRSLAKSAGNVARGRAVIAGDDVEDYWALRDVDFEVRRGEVLGIIGRNGAGKSTLLKILGRITEPSAGRVTVRGRVASLLEVGTGFHGELTGRENIFLNGAILGMSRAEVQRKFDEIVAFSGVERFLDTPVKRYSSGMYVRLAFAVAAHLEPEILLVDEVLAVGDTEFQQKCLGKMQQVADGGRTVLFVSHNLAVVSTLCNRALLMEGGSVAFDGPVHDALTRYAASAPAPARSRPGASAVRVTDVRVGTQELQAGGLKIEVDFEADWELRPVLIGAVIYNAFGAPVFGFNSAMDRSSPPTSASRGTAELAIPELAVHPGVYRVALWVGERNENHEHIPDAARFEVVAAPALPGDVSIDVIGSMRVEGTWRIHATDRVATAPLARTEAR